MLRKKQKYIISLVCAVLMSVTGCVRAYHQWAYEPQVSPLQSSSYEVIGEAESKVSNFSLLWVWSVTEHPDYDRAIREMISEKGGDDVIDVSFWIEKQQWILGTVNVMHIRATVIRYTQE